MLRSTASEPSQSRAFSQAPTTALQSTTFSGMPLRCAWEQLSSLRFPPTFATRLCRASAGQEKHHGSKLPGHGSQSFLAPPRGPDQRRRPTWEEFSREGSSAPEGKRRWRGFKEVVGAMAKRFEVLRDARRAWRSPLQAGLRPPAALLAGADSCAKGNHVRSKAPLSRTQHHLGWMKLASKSEAGSVWR